MDQTFLQSCLANSITAAMAFLTYVSDEILLMVAGYLGEFPLLQHRRALAALCLTGNRRLLNFFEPILYKLCLRDDQFCPMKWAAWNGKVGPMRRAAANQVDIDRVGGWTPQFQVDTRRVLTDWYYPIHPRALELAVVRGRNACIDWLLQHGANMDDEKEAMGLYIIPNTAQQPRWRLLFWAIRYNRPHTIQFLLARGVGPILSSQLPGFKPMHLAAALGHEDLFDMLLDIPGCAINDTDSSGNTILHYASRGTGALYPGGSGPRSGDASLSGIQSLLQRGADTTLVNDAGETALEFSLPHTDGPRWQPACLLLAAEPQGFVPSDRLIVAAIIRAEKNGDGDMFLRRLLVGRPVSCLYSMQTLKIESGWWYPSVLPNDQGSLLLWSLVEHATVQRSHYGDTLYTLPELLLSIGATPHLADTWGRTPLHACVFLSLSGDDYVLDEETVLIFDDSIIHQHRPLPFNVIPELLRRRGSLDTLDDEGHTPLDYAADEMDTFEHEDGYQTISPRTPCYARRVTNFTLKVAYEFGMCPTDAVKTRLMARLGRDVLHLDDPLAALE